VNDSWLGALLLLGVLGLAALLGFMVVDSLGQQSQLAAAAVSTSSGRSSSRNGQPVPTPPLETWEYTLACINAGYYVPQDDVSVFRFRYLLASLEFKTYSTVAEISDMTVKARDMLREQYGIDESVLALMEDANTAIPAGMRMKYEEVLTVLLILRGTS